MVLSVFGTKPVDAIYLSTIPYAVRWNCKDGGLFIGGYEDDYRRSKSKDKVDISIIKASRYFGSLGKTTNEVWLQMFFVPGPGCLVLPRNEVCVSYIKKQSVNNLMGTVSEAMDSGEPAEGLFTGYFQKQSGVLGTYYTIGFNWRKRETEEEIAQLAMIEAFMAGKPNLMDLNGTRDMTCIDRLSGEQIQELVDAAKAKASFEMQNAPALPAGK